MQLPEDAQKKEDKDEDGDASEDCDCPQKKIDCVFLVPIQEKHDWLVEKEIAHHSGRKSEE